MAGAITEDYEASGSRSDDLEGMSSERHCQSGDSIAEWRSSEQVENGTPSTSALFFDIDDEDDCGPKPSELFGRFTWKIDNFSTINKRELRSDIFEVGGYKWYVLIYPQGCDVCNHLSLFLCVADHDKLLPGWSHFAQFTMSVVNKDIKKSKYSDTLHRFWKKEHDWGWKKFMELSKVYDGFVNADALVIKAQVQVIREKAHCLFRCLDSQYRRELVRIYLSNVEQICRRFIDEKTGELGKLTEDKTRWLSFRSFWSGTDLNSRRRMSSDKTDAILKVVVKHFFIEKEVTSTLVMDSLYSGLKVLEFQSKNNNGGAKFLDLEKLPSAMVLVDEGMFVLADDIVPLLERVVKEPLPHQPLPPKDDKYLQNRTKDGSSGEEFSKDSVERDERRLMELGRRTVEIFVLFHIFSRIEVAYQEAVALKMQEELIQEEAASHADRAKRGGTEKDKRSKKKQAKQKRNTRKGKDKGSNDIFDVVQEKKSQESLSDVSVLGDSISKEAESVEKINTLEDASDVNVAEVLHPVLDDRDAGHVNWETDPSEVILPTEVSGSDAIGMQPDKMNQSSFCDSFSTCSTESVPSVMMYGSYKESSWPNNKIQSTPSREEHSKAATQNFSSTRSDAPSKCGSSHDVAATQPESDVVGLPLRSEFQKTQKHSDDKDVKVASVQKELIDKDQVDDDTFSKSKIRESSSSRQVGKPSIIVQQAKHNSEASNSIALCLTSNSTEFSSTRDPPSCCLPTQGSKPPPLESKLLSVSSTSKFGTQKYSPPAKSPGAHQASSVSRPSRVPLMPAQTPRPVVSTVQSAPLLSRSVSSSGRLGTGPSPFAPSYAPQSYRNAIVGKSATVTNATSLGHQTTSNQSIMYPHPPSTFMTLSPVPPAHTSDRIDQMSSFRPGTFGFSNTDALSSWQLSSDDSHSECASSSGRNSQAVFIDEFPHMDIINDLLNEENNGRASGIHHQNFSQQYSFPYSSSAIDIRSLSLSAQFNQSEQLYDHGFQSAYATSTNPLQGLQNGHLSELGFSAYANSAYASSTSPHQGLRNGHLSQHDLPVYTNSAYVSSTTPFQGLRNGHHAQHDLSAYDNSQIEGAIENQQPFGQHAEISMPNLRNGDTNRYTARQLPDNSGQSGGIDRYMYRPFSKP